MENQNILHVRIVFLRELELLLHYNSFAMSARYGYFGRESFTSATRYRLIVALPALPA